MRKSQIRKFSTKFCTTLFQNSPKSRNLLVFYNEQILIKALYALYVRMKSMFLLTKSLDPQIAHRKKKYREFPVPSRDVSTKLSLGGNMCWRWCERL